MKYYLFILLTVVVFCFMPIKVIADDCSFEKVMDQYKIEDAINDAVQSYNKGEIFFYCVANGYAPTTPELEDKKEFVCVFEHYTFKTLWVGADVWGRCKDRKKTEKHALLYAKKFNAQVKQLLKDSGRYKCDKS